MRQIITTVFIVVTLLIGATVSGDLHASEGFGILPEQSGAEFTPNIFVEQQTGCMDASVIKSSLSSVLKNREESQYIIISVVIVPTVDGALSFLRAIDRRTGEILLERTLHILPEECGGAHQVLKVMLEQFLTSFPIEQWKQKQAPLRAEPIVRTETVTVEKEVARLRFMLLLGIDSRWPSPSGDLEIALGLDAGAKRNGFIGRLIFRGGFPTPLGDGRYFEMWVQAGLGWRFSPKENFSICPEIRAGALRVSGYGYEKNYHQWLAIVEAELSLLWKTGPIWVGPAVAFAPLFYEVYTDAGERAELQWIRLGIVFGIPVGKSTLK